MLKMKMNNLIKFKFFAFAMPTVNLPVYTVYSFNYINIITAIYTILIY